MSQLYQPVFADDSSHYLITMDNADLLANQINILKTRLLRSEAELARENSDEHYIQSKNHVTKSMLDKVTLNLSVTKSSLQSISIEHADALQNITWLEKSIQEIQNQLNVLKMFGIKFANQDRFNINHYQTDLIYQKRLLVLEKERYSYLSQLRENVLNLLHKQELEYNVISSLLHNNHLAQIKKQGAMRELKFQQLQNEWLNQVNLLSDQLSKINPQTNFPAYINLERNIFYANENANYAYLKALITRYKNQIQEMNFSLQKETTINLLNEIRGQIQSTNKQIARLNGILEERENVLKQHVSGFEKKQSKDPKVLDYVKKLANLKAHYGQASIELTTLVTNLQKLQTNLDNALQKELSLRQGFTSFGSTSLLELGKEIIVIPALSFEIIKSLSTHLVDGFNNLSFGYWILFFISEIMLLGFFFLLRRFLIPLALNSDDQFNLKCLSIKCLDRNFFDLLVVGNMTAIMLFLDVSLQHFSAIISLGLVWLIFKTLLTISHISLIETTHDTTGHDVKLYYRLKWIIMIGGMITAFTVFVHQLPVVGVALRDLCDQFFLLLLMIISLMLLRSWEVVSNLILSHIEPKHPYIQKSISLIGLLIPILIFINAFLGLMGYLNLIITISRYEGIFLLVLFTYLILRGLLSDGMENLSRLFIQYFNNGWLWTEAFLKPLDKVLRVTLFFSAWAMLFLLFGWDEKSPIVERLTRLLHYHLINFLNTTITPLNIIELFVVISIFYWTAKWTREFVYRLLLSRTQDMGIRNSIALLSQYSMVVLGGLICLRVLGIDLGALAVVFSVFAFGIGWGLRDLANNFVCGFLILLERPLRVGDIVSINDIEGEVINIGSRAVTVRTWDHMDLVVPNVEIFNKSFTNWTAKDNIVRSVLHVKISRYDNPHNVKIMIYNVLSSHKEVLQDPHPEVYLKEMTDNHMDFQLRYYVNIRQIKSRTSVASSVLMQIWDIFAQHGIKPPHPQQEIFISNERPKIEFQEGIIKQQLT